jgi:enterobacterial common antigen flippase
MSSVTSTSQSTAEVLQAEPRPASQADGGGRTYGQILKSTALVGGSSMINIVIGIVRTKAMAMLLGPAGFGLSGLYLSVANLTQSIAGVGINSSGVRQIALAVGSEDTDQIARTVSVLRRTSIVLGALGAVLLLILSKPISVLTFNNDQYASGVALLSLAVFFNLVSAGQGALIQGMRRIADLAKVAVLGALFGTLITIPMVYWLRERGIVPSLVAIAAAALMTSWYYSRKIKLVTPAVTPLEVWQEASILLKLGFAFMAADLLMIGSSYLIRIMLLQKLGLAATGLYQCAWTLGGLYIGLVLQAMGADFYPRLTASANDNTKCNRLVNEQAHINLLLAGPGVVATLTLAPLVIATFYAANFGAAVGTLRWICLGVMMRVISWPTGFIMVAKGERSLFLGSDIAWAAVHLGLASLCIGPYGLAGAGIAFCGSYVSHVFVNYFIVRRLSGFRWSAENRNTGLLYLGMVAVVFFGFSVLPYWAAVSLGIVATLLSGVYSIKVVLTLVPVERIPHSVRQIFMRLGLLARLPNIAGGI